MGRRLDRDSEIVAPPFDERNRTVTTMIANVIRSCQTAGICDQASRDFQEFAEFRVTEGIDRILFNPDAVFMTTARLLDQEVQTKGNRP